MKESQSVFSSVLKQLGHDTAVLVVDDSLVCRRSLANALTRYEFSVIEVGSGAEALEIAEARGPDLIITDVHMPEMDGYELCRRIKRTPAIQDTPVIFVTTESETNQRLDGFDAGGADYITKGADDMEIIARVRAHVQISTLQKQLKANRDQLASQLEEIAEQNKRERELRQQVENHQTQMLQNEKMASIGQLAAGVAHEINNPIGFISSNLNTLQDYANDLKRYVLSAESVFCCPDDSTVVQDAVTKLGAIRSEIQLQDILEDLDDLVAESIEGTRRVRQIVADMRDFSHVDAPDAARENINELIQKTINVARNEIKYKAELDCDFGDVPDIPCFGGKLSQVFLNILVNAAQAIETSGTIKVQTRCDGDCVRITISDDGAGIDEEKIGRIFDPFYTTKAVGSGTGLGLHLSYKIIEAHHGSIHATSEVGVGTTFHITLPLTGIENEEHAPHG